MVADEVAENWNASGCESTNSVDLLRISRRSCIRYVVGFAGKVPERTKFLDTPVRGQGNSALSGLCRNKLSAHPLLSSSNFGFCYCVFNCLSSLFSSFLFYDSFTINCSSRMKLKFVSNFINFFIVINRVFVVFGLCVHGEIILVRVIFGTGWPI